MDFSDICGIVRLSFIFAQKKLELTKKASVISTFSFRSALTRSLLRANTEAAFPFPAYTAVLFFHFGGIGTGVVGDEQHLSVPGVGLGQAAFLLWGQLAVFIPQEKHVWVVAEGPPAQLAAAEGVIQGMLGGDAFPVE